MEIKPRVFIIGAAAVIVSNVKLEDWKRVTRYASEPVMVMDKDGEPIFQVGYGPGTGCVSENGIQWGSYTTEEGNATVTLILDEDLEDKWEAVQDVAGLALACLERIEQVILGEMDEEYEDSGARFIVI